MSTELVLLSSTTDFPTAIDPRLLDLKQMVLDTVLSPTPNAITQMRWITCFSSLPADLSPVETALIC